MSDEHSIQRYRYWYAKLLQLYPKPYRERFGKGMEQIFNDLLRERTKEEKLFTHTLWLFVETSAEIIKENITHMIMQNTAKRLSIWAIVIALLLLIPFVLTLLASGPAGEGWHWTLPDFVLMGGVLFSVALVYELIARRSKITLYRAAFSIGLAGAFLLFWVNGAVGIIGNEGNPANLMYGAVFVVGLIGSLVARFKARGMARTLFTAALVQMLIPVVALFIWPADHSWGAAGVFGVFMLNAFFAVVFLISALLFRQSAINLDHSKESR